MFSETVWKIDGLIIQGHEDDPLADSNVTTLAK
jgi:hypothetical protein